MTIKPTSLGSSEGCALLTEAQAATLLGVSRSYLAKSRVTGNGPEFIRIGRSVRYMQEGMQAFLKQHRCRSTAECRQAGGGK